MTERSGLQSPLTVVLWQQHDNDSLIHRMAFSSGTLKQITKHFLMTVYAMFQCGDPPILANLNETFWIRSLNEVIGQVEFMNQSFFECLFSPSHRMHTSIKVNYRRA